ncbi:MAG: alpha/beta fold hydrolase, partial [Rhodospirillales bacterium]
MTPRECSMPVLGPSGFFKLAWTEWGPLRAKRTVLCVHGLAESGEAWRGWVPHFARHYRVVRLDLRGFG